MRRLPRMLLVGALIAFGQTAAITSAGASTLDPQTDFGWATADSPAASISVGERNTGVPGMTPTLKVNRRGTLFMTVATDNSVLDGQTIIGKADTRMLRSRDDGRSWTQIKLPEGIIASEANLYLDSVTDRLYAFSMSYDVTDCGYPVAWTDDEGETWETTQKRPGCVPFTVGDWPQLFTGPPPAGVELTNGAERAIYTCNFVPDILVAASLWCWSSFDGGKTFGQPSLLPAINVACLATDGTKIVHGNGIETIVHGGGQVLRDGAVVVPVTLCGRIIVMRSTDAAKTWKVIDTGSDGMGWFNWLQNILKQSGADNIYNMMLQQNIAQDDEGNLFLPYPATGGLKLAYSRDGGLTWKQRGIISPPEVAIAWIVSATARGNGELALSYLGTSDQGDPVLGSGERFQNWIGYSPNVLSEPVVTAPTSPITEPALVGGASLSCCATLQYFVESTGVAFAGPDHLRAVFVRTGTTPNPNLTLGKATITRGTGSAVKPPVEQSTPVSPPGALGLVSKLVATLLAFLE